MNPSFAHQLKSELDFYTGTTAYYRLTSQSVLTDGVNHLADKAGSYWLVFLFTSYLVQLSDDFAVLKFKKSGFGATVLIEDGNDNVHFQQKIEYTDFPLEAITLFAGKDVDNWVIMLPSEY